MSTVPLTTDPDRDHPRKGDTVLYVADNEASFGGIVEECHLGVDEKHRFRIVGHDGLFLHEAESWRSRYISRPRQQWKLGTPGTATVLYGGDLHRAHTRKVFYTAGVVAPGETTRPWVDELGNLLAEDEVTAFVPDDAEALRARVAELEAEVRQWQGGQQLLETRAEDAEADVERLTAELETVRGWYQSAVRTAMKAEEQRDEARAEVERLRAARTLPTRERVSEALAGHMTMTVTDMHRCACHAPVAPTADRHMAEQAHLMHVAGIVLALFEQGGAAPKVTQEQAAEVLWLNEYDRAWSEANKSDWAVYMNAAAVVIARMGGAE